MGDLLNAGYNRKQRDLLNAGYNKPKITIKNGKRYIKISGMSYKTLFNL